MEATCFSDTSVNIYHTKQRHSPGNNVNKMHYNFKKRKNKKTNTKSVQLLCKQIALVACIGLLTGVENCVFLYFSIYSTVHPFILGLFNYCLNRSYRVESNDRKINE